jgi:hypothetical protein
MSACKLSAFLVPLGWCRKCLNLRRLTSRFHGNTGAMLCKRLHSAVTIGGTPIRLGQSCWATQVLRPFP